MEAHHDGTRPLILDELSSRLEQFRLLGESDEAATDEILSELGGEGRVAIPLAFFVLFTVF